MFIAGDLLNQLVTALLCQKALYLPGHLWCMFNLCGRLSLGAMLIEGGFAKHILTGASSHNCSAERRTVIQRIWFPEAGLRAVDRNRSRAVVLGSGGRSPCGINYYRQSSRYPYQRPSCPRHGNGGSSSDTIYNHLRDWTKSVLLQHNPHR